MARKLATIMVRLNEKEKEKLKRYAEKLGVSMSEIIQDYIKSFGLWTKENSFATINCEVTEID